MPMPFSLSLLPWFGRASCAAAELRSGEHGGHSSDQMVIPPPPNGQSRPRARYAPSRATQFAGNRRIDAQQEPSSIYDVIVSFLFRFIYFSVIIKFMTGGVPMSGFYYFGNVFEIIKNLTVGPTLINNFRNCLNRLNFGNS